MKPVDLAARTAVALVHYPVYDRNRQVIASAVTNLDIHDIARAARTFGLYRYFIVTPLQDQQQLVERVREHWLTGWGAGYNPKRKEALSLLQVLPDIAAAKTAMNEVFGMEPLVVVTGARAGVATISCPGMLERMEQDQRPMLLLFGTGWGMTEQVFSGADAVLDPISSSSDYNHLSVRSAVSIYLDRLFGTTNNH